MNDNKTLKDIIIEVTEQEIDANCPELSASPEEMMAQIANKEKARKKKCLGYIAVAAVLILAFVVIGVKFGDSILHVDADKNGKEEIITDEGVIVEDEGWGSGEEGDIIITDWTEVRVAKMHVEELLIPTYIPNGYEFRELNVETSNEGARCIYQFFKDKDNIEITVLISNENMVSQQIEGETEKIPSKKGSVYIKNSGRKKIATIYVNDGIMLEVYSILSNDEIVEIIENTR